MIKNKLKCFLLGHQYYIYRHFTPYSRRVCCDRCKGDWGMNDDARVIIPWDRELEDMYKIM